jgi:hypothetical protein
LNKILPPPAIENRWKNETLLMQRESSGIYIPSQDNFERYRPYGGLNISLHNTYNSTELNKSLQQPRSIRNYRNENYETAYENTYSPYEPQKLKTNRPKSERRFSYDYARNENPLTDITQKN